MADLVRLTAPNGATVKVDEEQAERLLQSGYAPASKTADTAAKAPAKKAAASRKTPQTADTAD